MRNIFLIILSMLSLWLIPTSGRADNRIDSLKSIINTVDINKKADICIILAKYYKNVDPAKTLDYAEQALQIAKNQNNPVMKGAALLEMGEGERCLGNLDIALDHYYKSLDVYTELNDREGIAAVHNNLGIFYRNLKNYEKAIEYYDKALEVNIELGRVKEQASTFNNIGNIYWEYGKLDQAMEYYQKAIDIYSRLDEKQGLSAAFINIGTIYWTKGEYQNAMDYFERSKKLKERIGDKSGMAIVLNNIGATHQKLGDLNKALSYFYQSAEIARDINFKEVLQDDYLMLSAIYEQLDKPYKSLEFQKLYAGMKDSILSEQTNKKIIEMQVRYETEQKEKENALLREANQNQLYYFIIISGLILIVVIVVWNRNRTRSKANHLLFLKNIQIEHVNSELSQMNEKITEQKEQLEKLNKKLHDANQAKDKFFSIIAHELRNPLWWFRNLTELLAQNFDTMSRDKIQETTQALDESAKNSFHLIENLLQWSRTQTDRVSYKPGKINLADIVEKNVSHLSFGAKNKNIDLIYKIEEHDFVFADRNMLNTIIRNLISNAIKFTPEKGKVIIKSKDEGDDIRISIIDNGIGIDENALKDLFRIDVQKSSLGTAQEKGSGLGLILCKEFVEKNNGRIWVDSQKELGTAVHFTLPKEYIE